MSKSASKFEGLSSPAELQQTWFNMTEGQGLPLLFVIWEFTPKVMPLHDGIYVVNIAYEHTGDGIGHYVAMAVADASIWYFDPIGTLPPRWLFEQFHKFYLRTTIDLTGGQRLNGTSCGYRCLVQLAVYLIDGKDMYSEAERTNKDKRKYISYEQGAENFDTNISASQLKAVKQKTAKEFQLIRLSDVYESTE